MIGIGIDTGGTYTDAVVYDLETQQTLSYGKALTTHHRLTGGILGALDSLSRESLDKADFLALSTTLATNACVEGIGGNAKLIFINVEVKTVQEMHEKYGLPAPREIYFLDTSTPGWQDDLLDSQAEFAGCDSLAIVQIFARQDHARLEKKVRELLEPRLGIPCVCGYDLFQDLNVLRRGASTLLNARLIPVIKSFLSAVQEALAVRRLKLPIVIVRSDGSLMSLDFTLRHPVETLLCGPAASIMAGAKLTDQKDALVVDMGGTTTDIAIIKDHLPVTVKSGISIGSWKTFVKGLYVDTFGLGGDSAVRYRDGELYLDTRRVVPLCMLAAEYPQVYLQLARLNETVSSPHPLFLHEFLVLQQDIENHSAYNELDKKLCRCLKNGPLSLSQAAAAVNKDIYSLNTTQLEANGIIIRSGLTPTDIMHIRGDFSRFRRDAAVLGVAFTAMCVKKSPEQLADEVYRMVEQKLYSNLVRILLKQEHAFYEKNEDNPVLQKLIEDSYKSAIASSPGFLSQRFTTAATLIGIGAPIHIFLQRVAELLGTTAVFPQHAEVANALGAVIGNISASFRVLIKPVYTPSGISEYQVFGPDETAVFEEYESAKKAAIEIAFHGAEQAAKKQGAVEVALSYQARQSNPAVGQSSLFLEEEVIGRAIGRFTF